MQPEGQLTVKKKQVFMWSIKFSAWTVKVGIQGELPISCNESVRKNVPAK